MSPKRKGFYDFAKMHPLGNLFFTVVVTEDGEEGTDKLQRDASTDKNLQPDKQTNRQKCMVYRQTPLYALL